METTWDTSFIQHQEFTSVVSGTLSKYQFGIGIFHEWLQNADDAKAKKFVIMLDFNSYPTNSLIGEKMNQLQGPLAGTLITFSNHVN